MDTNSTLSQEIKAYYKDEFLAHATPKLIHKEGGDPEVLGSNNGATVTWTRMAVRANATTPLATGVNPTHTGYTDVNVTATLQEFGDNAKIAKFLSTTSIDKGNAQKVFTMGEAMGNTLDALVRDKLFAGATVQYANSRVSKATLAAGDIINPTEFARAQRDLDNANALEYDGGGYMAKLNPYTLFDVMQSTAWLNVKSYSDPTDIYNGEVGTLFNFRVQKSTQPKVETDAGAGSNLTAYSNFFHGAHSYGIVDLEGDMPELHIVTGADAGNVAARFANISWAGSFTAVVLNAAWILNKKSLASA